MTDHHPYDEYSEEPACPDCGDPLCLGDCNLDDEGEDEDII